jgi:hypothetical protein
MNQDETIIGYDKSVAVDAKLFSHIRKQKKDCIIAIYIHHIVN